MATKKARSVQHRGLTSSGSSRGVRFPVSLGDDLKTQIQKIFGEQWSTRDGQQVPDPTISDLARTPSSWTVRSSVRICQDQRSCSMATRTPLQPKSTCRTCTAPRNSSGRRAAANSQEPTRPFNSSSSPPTAAGAALPHSQALRPGFRVSGYPDALLRSVGSTPTRFLIRPSWW